MSLDRWTAPIQPLWVADGTAYASSNTLTDVSPTPNLTIAANTLQPGMTLRLYAAGQYSTTGTPTLTLGFYYGAVAGVALVSTGAQTATTNASSVGWEFRGYAQVRAMGSSGSIKTSGFVHVAATAFGPIFTTTTVDTTAAKALTVGATWSANSASNTLTCHQFSVELL